MPMPWRQCELCMLFLPPTKHKCLFALHKSKRIAYTDEALNSKVLHALSRIAPSFTMPTFWLVGTLPDAPREHLRAFPSHLCLRPIVCMACWTQTWWGALHHRNQPSINLISYLGVGYSLKQFAIMISNGMTPLRWSTERSQRVP